MAKTEFVQNDNTLAIAYYRFSSHAQNDASIDQQRERVLSNGHKVFGYKIAEDKRNGSWDS